MAKNGWIILQNFSSFCFSLSDNENSRNLKPFNVSIKPRSEEKVGGIGEKMLKKLGWSESEGLGKDGRGITAPVTVLLNEIISKHFKPFFVKIGID